jgi:hypothetical protein
MRAFLICQHKLMAVSAPVLISLPPEFEQFFLAATAQNIKRLVRFLSGPTACPIPAATA